MNPQTLFVYSHVDGVIVVVGHIPNVRVRVTINGIGHAMVGTVVQHPVLP